MTQHQINSQEDFSKAIETLMNNEETRTALLERLMNLLPGNAEIELANLYFTNREFENGLNNYVWERRVS